MDFSVTLHQNIIDLKMGESNVTTIGTIEHISFLWLTQPFLQMPASIVS